MAMYVNSCIEGTTYMKVNTIIWLKYLNNIIGNLEIS